MWNHETDLMFLDMRADAVLIFSQNTKKLLYLNPAAKDMFPQTDENTVYSDLMPDDKIEALVNMSISSGRPCGRTLDEQPWAAESVVLHTTVTEWEGEPVVLLAIDRRSYGPPPEALQMMKAVLTSAYFTAIRVDLQTKRCAIITDKNPLMNQAAFPSFTQYIERYAEALIHPEDREQFVSAFSMEQIRLFMEANTTPTCTVRRLSDEEYRWASFTLAAVNPMLVLLFGMDSNEQHLIQERSDRYRSELELVSQRNRYIISSVSDIFRLMLHIDVRTGETIVCALHPDLAPYFSYNKVYAFEEVTDKLLKLVHPEDREHLIAFTDLKKLPSLVDEAEHKISFEYRRIAAEQDPNLNAKWTRSVFSLVAFEDDEATEAIYAVQDIDAQKRREFEAKRLQESLTEQFYTLIRNRYIWFIENDFEKKVSRCHRIANHTVMPPMECPFGQFFERMIMPHCHPDDFKNVAKVLLPLTAEESYKQGKRQVTIDYRHKFENGWRYVRAEMYLQKNEQGVLHTLIYISDIDDEVNSRNALTKAEHEQLELHRKVDLLLTDTCIHIGEADLDADTIRLYHIDGDTLTPETDTISFSDYISHYPERHIHPEQQADFRRVFSFENILRAQREQESELKQMFLMDPDQSGEYYWCSVSLKFVENENGKRFVMTYVENVDDEVHRRDVNLDALHHAKEQLLENIRTTERSRIRRAHVFLNIASNFQLALNQIYGALDKLERGLPENARGHEEISTIFKSYERLSAMTECTKDLLLLENNQLPLLREPVSLPNLLRKLRNNAGDVFDKKKIILTTYTTRVTDEVVLSDSQRLAFLLENLFINVMRSLPDGTEVTLQLAESPIPNAADEAIYEFSLVTRGDSVSQDIQSSILSPIPQNDPMKSIEAAFFLNDPNVQQHNLYLSKRLIQVMQGTLDYVPLPEDASAVILRLPMRFEKQQVLFPLRRTFGKRVLVWDSRQAAAISMVEILRESGMHCDLQRDFENTVAYLKLAVKQNTPYDMIVVRQSDLNKQNDGCLTGIRAVTKETPILVISDVPHDAKNAPDEYTGIYPLLPPVFRSVVAEQLRTVFGEQTKDE